MAFGESCEVTAKAFVMLMAILIVVNGVAVLILGLEVNSSEAFTKVGSFYGVMSADSFDSNKVAMISIGVAAGTILIGLGGCWGAISSNHCILGVFGTLLGAAALTLIALCAAAMVFIKATTPQVKKEMNRMCGNGAPELLKQGLNCEEHGHFSNTTLVRRLTQDASVVGSSGMGMMQRFVSRSAVLYAVAMEVSTELPRWAGGVSGDVAGVDGGRRLFPGVTEEDLIVRVCARLGPDQCPSPCHLVDLVCEPPEEFNPWEACVCDRSGPRAQGPDGLIPAVCPPESGNPMCQMDLTGRRKGVFCMETTRSTGSDSTGTSEIVEQCFVLPTAKCQGRGGTDPSDCSAAGETPCVSQGPCTDPDSRSKLLVQAETQAKQFVVSVGILGGIALLMALCSFCLCCELHTGKSAVEHARSLAQNDPEDYYDDKDFWRSQGSTGSAYLQ